MGPPRHTFLYVKVHNPIMTEKWKHKTFVELCFILFENIILFTQQLFRRNKKKEIWLVWKSVKYCHIFHNFLSWTRRKMRGLFSLFPPFQSWNYVENMAQVSVFSFFHLSNILLQLLHIYTQNGDTIKLIWNKYL